MGVIWTGWIRAAALLFLVAASASLEGRDFLSVDDSSKKLALVEGDYDLWVEKPEGITDLQAGTYEREEENCGFSPK
ncbi:hypothetical protein [Hydrogenimonas sp.]